MSSKNEKEQFKHCKDDEKDMLKAFDIEQMIMYQPFSIVAVKT